MIASRAPARQTRPRWPLVAFAAVAFALGGCLGESAPGPAEELESPQVTERTYSETWMFRLTDAYLPPVLSYAGDFNCVMFFTPSEAQVLGGVAEATWDAQSPLAEELVLEFRRNWSSLARSEGRSPLQFSFGSSEPIHGNSIARYSLRVGLPDAGATVNQEVEVTVSMEYRSANNFTIDRGACASTASPSFVGSG